MWSRRRFLKTLGIGAAAGGAAMAAGGLWRHWLVKKKPNIVYVLADDMGYGDVSCLNADSKIHTANIDRMAAAGMIFRDAHASSAVCTPSRYSILTGRYNWRSAQKSGVNFGFSGPLIERGRMTVASLLKTAGYRTACVGKWHLGWTWAKRSAKEDDVDYSRPIADGPTSVGFDYFFGISASLDMAPYVYVENDRVTAEPTGWTAGSSGKQMWREGAIAPDFKHEDVLPTLTEKALAWIDQSAKTSEPFFLYFPLPAPHTPILPTPEFRGKSGTNEYGDFCLQVDDVMGQLLAALDRAGIAEDTIIIFTADNGCSPMADFAELAAVGHKPSYVFRGHKADIYEGGHRIPLVIRWGGGIAPGSATDQTVCLTDLLATCSDLLDLPLPAAAGEDSVSNLPLWQGRVEQPVREATVHTSIDGSLSIRRGRWKLEMCPGSGGWSHPQPGSKDASNLPSRQLYDLTADIGERRNLIDEQPAVAAELQALLTSYVQRGRSTPGAAQGNTGPVWWNQLWWMKK
ncbi:MAG: arylsulfatase [Planctomycetaceae bacterium]|nr:arylsulfatase [Planctomycetaceae bacterium]